MSMNPAPDPDALSLRKLLVGLVLTLVLFVAAPSLFAFLGWTSALSTKGAWVLAIVAFGMVSKMLAGDVAGGEFLFHKYGYDNCIMTLGALATATALQLTSTTDLFPGLSSSGVLSGLNSLSNDIVVTRIILLFTSLLIVLLCTLLTARICFAIKRGRASERRGLAFLNTIVGVLVLVLYIFVLVGKG